jgi:hypothetical protein
MNCTYKELLVPECVNLELKSVTDEDLNVKVVNSLNQVKYYPVVSDYAGVFTLEVDDFISFGQYTLSVQYRTGVPAKLIYDGEYYDELVIQCEKTINFDLPTYIVY